MGHKIHPIAFRLAVNRTWLNLTHPQGAQRDAQGQVQENINKLINNCFLAQNILTSYPIIKITPASINIHIKAYSVSGAVGQKVAYGDKAPETQRMTYLAVLIKSIIQKKLNMRVQIIITGVDSYNSDPKIMGDWLAMMIGSRPLRLKGIVKGALNQVTK